MGIQIASNFKYNGPLPNFERDMFKTIAEMKSVNDATLPEVFIATNVEEAGTIFVYSKSNAIDAELGKWRRVSGAVSTDDIGGSIKKWGSADTLAKLKTDVVADADNFDTKFTYIAEVKKDEDKDDSATLYLVKYKPANPNNPVSVADFTFDFLCYVGVSEKVLNDKVDKSQLGVATVELKENDQDPDKVTGHIIGVATLDTAGKVPAEQLPSYVDDVIEGYFNGEHDVYILASAQDGSVGLKVVASDPQDKEIALADVIADLPDLTGDGTEYVETTTVGDDKFYEEADFNTEITGEKGKIYVDITTGDSYRFGGTIFVRISNSDAEKNVINGIKLNDKLLKVDPIDRTVNIKLDDIKINSKFTTSSPVNNPIGRFVNGEEVTADDNMSIVDAINKLLHKYVPATVGITITPATTLYEKGTSAANVEVVTNITKGSNDITKIELFVNNISAATFSDVANGGSYNYTLPTFNTDTVIKVVVTDDEGSTEKKVEIKFANKTYYGTVAAGTAIDDVAVKGLTDTLKLDKKYTYDGITANNSHIVYAYPKTMGDLTTIKDGNGFEYLASYTKSIVSVGGVDYNVYTLTSPASVTNFKQIYA